MLGDVLDRAADGDEGVLYIHADGDRALRVLRRASHSRAEASGGPSGARFADGRSGRPADRASPEFHRHVLGVRTGRAGARAAGESYAPRPLNRRPAAAARRLGHLGRPVVVAERNRLSAIRNSAASMEFLVVAAVEDLETEIAGRRHRPEPDDVAVLMLTSGSTGAPKAVMLTHRNLLSRCAASRQMNGFTPRDVTLNWMPLDHVAGLIYFHVRDVYLACRQIHVPTGVILADPLKWLDELDRHRATITFAPNFAFALVNDREKEIGRRSWDLSCVRHVLNGAEAIVPRTARTFLRLLAAHGLPRESMRPAWGMSETSSGVIYGDRFSLDTTADDDPFVEVGRPIPGLSVRIVDADDRVLDQGQAGRLQVRGAVVTSGYFNAPELTRLAFTDHGWFKTGDLGTIRDGRVTVTGREKDVIIVNSVNYYCHAIEAAVEAVAGVETSFVAACPVRPPGANTDRLAVFFHASNRARARPAAADSRRGARPDRDRAGLPTAGASSGPAQDITRQDSTLGTVAAIPRRRVRPDHRAGRPAYRQRQHDSRMVLSENLASKRGNRRRRRSWPWRCGPCVFRRWDRLGAEVRQRLEHDGVRCCTVIPGDSFEQRSAGVSRSIRTSQTTTCGW